MSAETLVGGSLRFIGSKTDDSKKNYRNRQKYLPNREKHRWYCMENEQLAGIIAVADTIKADSPKAVKELRDMGIKVVMLTGDNERTAKAIGSTGRCMMKLLQEYCRMEKRV